VKGEDDRRASDVGQAIDDLMRGHESGLEDPAVVAARRIRASLHPPAVDPERRRQIADTVAGQWAWRRRSRVVRTILAVAATILVVVFLTLLVRTSGTAAKTPEHQLSRETATLIPGPFPADQTASDRIDLIYSDRLDGLRQATLAGVGP
jgi:hypothetical protein